MPRMDHFQDLTVHGTLTFGASGAVVMPATLGQFIVGNLNSVLFVDGVRYATIAAAITAAGANKTLIIVPSNYAGANPSLPIAANITILDLRGDSVPATREDTSTTGVQIDLNGTIEGSLAGFSVHQGRTSPSVTSSAVLATSKFTGTLPDGNTLAGLTAESATVGAVTPGTGVVAGIEAYAAIRSTGGTIADVRGLTASVNLDLASSTTNVTDASSVFANAPADSSTAASIVNAYSLKAEQPTVGTSRNYSAFLNGHVLMPNDVNLDAIDSGGTVRRFITFLSTDYIDFKPLVDANGIRFRDRAASVIEMEVNTTGVGVGLTPAHPFHVEKSRAGDIIAKFRNTSATGYGASFVPGANSNYGIAVQDAAQAGNVFSVLGSGDVLTKRIKASVGTALVAGDFALDANWGAGAAVSAVTGTDQGFSFTVTAAGVPGANPTVVLTFKDGTWTSSPLVTISRSDLTAPTTGFWAKTAVSATTVTFTFVGTPVAASTYSADVIVMGR